MLIKEKEEKSKYNISATKRLIEYEAKIYNVINICKYLLINFSKLKIWITPKTILFIYLYIYISKINIKISIILCLFYYCCFFIIITNH